MRIKVSRTTKRRMVRITQIKRKTQITTRKRITTIKMKRRTTRITIIVTTTRRRIRNKKIRIVEIIKRITTAIPTTSKEPVTRRMSRKLTMMELSSPLRFPEMNRITTYLSIGLILMTQLYKQYLLTESRSNLEVPMKAATSLFTDNKLLIARCQHLSSLLSTLLIKSSSKM
jgi:hypothetical protein